MFAALRAGNIASYKSATSDPVTSQFQESLDRRKLPQVKVMNIPESSKEEDLRNLFSPVATVKNVKILPVKEGKFTKIGFIDFETDSDVEKVIRQMNNITCNGGTLSLSKGNQGTNRDGDGKNNSNSRPGGTIGVKVHNIPDGTNEASLKNLFSGAGNVTKVNILPSLEGKDMTVGFVHFERFEESQKAVQLFNNYVFNSSNLRVMDIEGKKLYNNPINRDNSYTPQIKPLGRGAQLMVNVNGSNDVGQHRNRGPQAKVFGIPAETSEDDVKQLFSSAGNVISIKLLPLREGKDTHLGFVEYGSEGEVQTAVDRFNGFKFNNSILNVMFGNRQASSQPFDSAFQNNNSFQNSFNKLPWKNPTSRIPREMNDRNSNIPSISENTINMNRGDIYGNDEMPHMAPVSYIPPPPPETEAEIFQLRINEGINFEKYEHIPVEITGNRPTKPINKFSEANLHPICQMNIERAQYHKPTPVQKYALPAVLARRDLMACAQTGSGKTASFLLPVITTILKEGVSSVIPINGPICPLALIVVPTRELAIQIFNETRKFSYESQISPVVIYGGVSVTHQTDALKRGCHICIATPGRLEDFVRRGKLSFKDLKFFILDEADRMLDMGFESQLNEIVNNSEMPPKGRRTSLMFSATFPTEIQMMAANFLHDYLFLTVGRVGGACSDVQQTVLQVEESEKRNTLEKILQESGTDRTMVFVERKKAADFLASFLSQRNYPATSLNGDRSQQEREAALLDFRKGNAPVMVATAVAARGLDIDDVKHVINYDLPNHPSEYVHRIGRTGRIGNKGKATSFFDANRDQGLARHIVKMLSEAEQDVPDWLEQTALAAIGTGYGQDKSSFRDRRRVNVGGVIDNKNIPTPFPLKNQPAPLVKIADDDDEEW